MKRVPLVLFCCAPLVAFAQAPVEEWVVLEAADQYQLTDDGTKKELRIAARVVAPVSADAVRIEKFALRYENVAATNLDGAIEPREKLEIVNGFPSLVVEIDTAKANRAGAYELTLIAAVPGAADPAPKPRKLRLAFVHPEAVVRPPGTVHIERWLPTPWDEEPYETKSGRLTLELTSATSRLSFPTTGAMRFTVPPNVAFNGDVELTRTFGIVSHARAVSSQLAPRGSFPLGVSEADSVIRAPQLKSEVPFKVRVVTRAHWAWLLVAAALGFIAGWFIKVWLARTIELRKARLEAFAVLRNLEVAQVAHPDTEFVEAMADTRRNLELAIKAERDASKLAELAKTSQATFEAEFKKVTTRVAALKTDLNGWEDVLAVDRPLPPPLPTRLENARARLAEVRGLARVDLLRAEVALREETSRLANDVEAAVRGWKSDTSVDLDALVPQQLRLPADVAAFVATAVAKIRAQVDALEFTAKDATPDTLDASFRTWVTARDQMALSFGKNLAQELVRAATLVADELKNANGFAAPGLAELVPEAQLVGRELESTGVAPEEKLDRLVPGKFAALTALDARFKGLFAGALPDTSKKQMDLDTLLGERKYLDAAMLVVAERKPSPGGPVREMAALPVAAAAEAAASASIFEQAGQAQAAPRRGPTTPSLVPALDISVVATERQLRSALRVQTFVVGGVTLAVAYLTYSAEFIGTFKELAAIFAFAFGVDITADRLISLVKSAGDGKAPSS